MCRAVGLVRVWGRRGAASGRALTGGQGLVVDGACVLVEQGLVILGVVMVPSGHVGVEVLTEQEQEL